MATLDLEYQAVERPADAYRALDDGVEDGLHVRPRIADHAQDLRRRGLPIQRLRELGVARLQLLE